MSAYRIADLFAQRVKDIAPLTHATELTKIIAVSFVCGLADPNLFPHADLAAASEVATALNSVA
ncbi:hypothetical protein I8752_01435 [Nostocaceae cyanobacterium CENA369]|uniref:Uncharacterized protein n=1 Tax=Dendronalium phyllosphericum CENA369 TaxID=1725256 RepID=A0A8J7HX14_9NOST|nr:hypothetical protein [Dendronalium phyllosphericum]MBH8571710.1 hypothetical protein [Dendronalium phyllosphericum CENA369]